MKNFGLIFLFVLALGCDTAEVKRDRQFLQGNQALDAREYKQAIQFFNNAISLDKQFDRGYNNLGVALMRDGRAFEAIQAYNEALLINPEYWQCMENRAYAYEITGKFEKALRDYAQLSKEFPDSAGYHFGKGLVQSQLQQYTDARESFERVIQLKPDHIDAQINLANIDFFEGNLEQAKHKLEIIVTQFPDQHMAFNSLNQVYLSLGQFQPALQAIESALAIAPSNALLLNNRGYTLLKLGELQRAITDINQSIVIDSENKWAYRNKGIYYLLSGDCEQAKRYLKVAAEANPPVDSVDFYIKKCL